eukprot:Pgem_evm1s16359
MNNKRKTRMKDTVKENICEYPGCTKSYSLRRGLHAHVRAKHDMSIQEIHFLNERNRKNNLIRRTKSSLPTCNNTISGSPTASIHHLHTLLSLHTQN